jgi:hypothetical protein
MNLRNWMKIENMGLGGGWGGEGACLRGDIWA